MYAIVEIAGKQFRVQPEETIYVPHIPQEKGSAVTFDKVLLHYDTKATLGTPFIAHAKVTASVVGHGKEDTVIVFKKKRRKGYRVRRGHRQQYTQIHIDDITI